MEKQSGVYEILNTANGRRYIGQAVNIHHRWGEHRRKLRRNCHRHHQHLQNAWNKYGEAAFEFRVLGLCAPEHLTLFEQQWMDARKPEYNKCPAAGSTLGLLHSPAERAAKSVRQTGQKKSPAACAAQSARQLGRTLSPEWRANISKGKAGLVLGPHSPEWNKKISAAQIGREFSDGHVAKLAAAKLGTHQSDETKAKHVANMRGNARAKGAVHTAEMRAAKSQRQRGVPQLHYMRRMPLGIAYG